VDSSNRSCRLSAKLGHEPGIAHSEAGLWRQTHLSRRVPDPGSETWTIQPLRIGPLTAPKLYLHPELHRPSTLKTLSTNGDIAQRAISMRFFREFHAPAGRQVPQIHPAAGIFLRKIPIRQFFPRHSARNPPPAGRRFRPMGEDGNPAQKTGAQPGCPPDTRLGARVAHPSHKNKVEARVGHQFLCSVEGSAYMPFCAFWPGWTTR